MRLMRHALATKTEGTLVVPQWVSAPFWPLLFPDDANPAGFVREIVQLPRSEILFIPGRLGANLFKETPNTGVLALRIAFCSGC